MTTDLSRRAMLTAPTLLSLTSGTAACAQGAPATQTSATKILVACFSRSGNTRVIAGQIHRALGADYFEIRPARAYPDDYEQTVEQARRERDRGDAPALAARVENITTYDAIYLGFPIWGETAPPVVRSFLAAHDLTGKTLRPFITHGGFGLGDSSAVLTAHAPRARIAPAFSMEADQERRTLNLVTTWLGETKTR